MKTRKFANSLLSLVALLVVSAEGIAQPTINVQDNRSAAQLVQYLVGTNVATFNPVLNCDGPRNGTFQNVTSNLGVGSGIVLCSGAVDQPNGVAGPQLNAVGTLPELPGDPDLTLISGFTTKSACVLEFDFVPDIDTTSTLRFNYVFASEEYNGFDCTQYNDVFAFLLSGPGVGTNVNVALVPGTNIPVAINSINNGTNINTFCTSLGPGSPFPAYFIDNETANGQTVAFGGFTTKLEALATVAPCDTYHIKLAVANAVDNALQSAVFLEAGSFRVDDVNLDFTQIIEADSGYIAEGCNSSQFTASRDTTTNRPKKLCFQYGGTAINGVDYQLLPDSIILQPNTPSVSVPIIPFQDNLAEPGYEEIIITRVNCCTKTPIDTAKIRIYDSLQITLFNKDTGLCNPSPVQLNSLGAPVFQYVWQPQSAGGGITGANTMNATAIPPGGITNYSVTASFLTCPTVTKSFQVKVEPVPIVDIITEDTTICITKPMPIYSKVLPDTFSQYSYTWGPNLGLDNPFADTPYYYYAVPADYKFVLAVQTPLGCTGRDTIVIHSKPSAELVDVTTDTVIKYGEKVQLLANGADIYVWSPSQYLDFPNTADPIATVLDSNTYQVVGINQYGCRDTAYVVVDVDDRMVDNVPNAFSPNGDGENDKFYVKNIKYQKLNEFRVFNRYGTEVFSTTNPEEGWDGTYKGVKQDIGVYNYLIRVAMPGGALEVYKGDVTLVR
jgi:gliding motility-associated-like protein